MYARAALLGDRAERCYAKAACTIRLVLTAFQVANLSTKQESRLRWRLPRPPRTLGKGL